jgi:hypothetical protein
MCGPAMFTCLMITISWLKSLPTVSKQKASCGKDVQS